MSVRVATLLLAALLAGCGTAERAASDNRSATGPTPVASPAADRLAAAIAAAWPKGITMPTESPQDSFVYDDHKLIDTGFGPVLVSHGHIPDGAHATAGAIDIFYLEPAGAGFRVHRAFPKVVELGSMGDFSEWSITDKFTDLPVVYVEGGGIWQGYVCNYTRLVELRPAGPAKIADFQTDYDNKGAVGDEGESYEGKIADISKGKAFTVRYQGTRSFTERYVRRGGNFQLGGESRVPGC
jgi:hypothetical protein